MYREKPFTFYCVEHRSRHRRGSKQYEACIDAYFESLGEVEEEPEKEPILIEKSSITLQASQMLCRLKADAPDCVITRGVMYEKGVRTFERTKQPFIVTVEEYRDILNRGKKFFEPA